MPTTSNFGWTTPADTDLVKDGALAIRTLGNGIDTSFLDLKGGTTDQVLAKNSNTDLDFKWVAQDDSNAIQNAIVDAKGDLISATAADTPARLAVGANGTVLTADSAQTTGLKWASPAPSGKVLQVVQTVYSTEKAIASTSYTDTDLSASITPSSATSKVLVIVSQQVIQTRSAQDIAGMAIRIYRGATSVYEVAGTDNLYAQYMRATGATAAQLSSILSLVYLDSPSTTSATTYKTMARLENTTSSANSKFQTAGASSSITLIEIGA
jgi:hypothetical protein